MITLSIKNKQECLALLEQVTRKTNQIQKKHLSGSAALDSAYLFRDLLRDCANGHYDKLSFKAWIHVWAALLYFVESMDAICDGQPRGLTDDVRAFSIVERKFKKEIDAYKAFRLQHF